MNPLLYIQGRWLAALVLCLASATQAQEAVLTHGAASNEAPPAATLRNTYWKLVELDGQPVTMLPGQEREVRITLHSEGARLAGFSGCNPLMGTYVQEGQALRFTQLAGTRMACQPPIDALERKLLQMLGATTGHRIEGEQLRLLQGEQVLARFEAVYL